MAVSVCRPGSRLLLVPLVLACALAIPASASAVTYTVNSTADGPDKEIGSGGCETAVASQCTLRAAIQESNFFTAVDDEVAFAAAFNGQLADTITLGASFPAITDTVLIDGDGATQCATQAGFNGPCVGIDANSGVGLVVEDADGVGIEGLAITKGTFGIDVIDSSTGFTARNDWFGVQLDGAGQGNNTGVFLDPGSDLAGIGGSTAQQRNVFVNNTFVGLDILGASGTEVDGNYFGVMPDGTTQSANGKDIEVTSQTFFEAVGNQIGTNVANADPGAPASQACDGGCNVFAGSGLFPAAIDLQGDGGEETPPESTSIRGNYLGLNANGAAVGSPAIAGIRVGSSKSTVIGGDAPGEANHINGGSYGVFSGNGGVGADDLVVDGNLIGLDVAGTETLSPPSVDGIFDSSEGISSFSHTATITDNRIAMAGGIAIEQHSSGAFIAGNDLGRGVNGAALSAGATGVKVWGSVGGNSIQSNVVDGATANGILIENDHNLVTGNLIEDSGLAGIRIQDFLTLPSIESLIGNEAEEEENEISGSGGDAIEIVGEEDDEHQIRRNFGHGNAGLFIDLGADGPGNKATGPNDGIQAPVVAKATTAGISGSGARAGADIRVFEKATAAAGEIKGFLGKVKADGSGKWELSYGSKLAAGTNVGVTQTAVTGTSELAIAATETDKTDQTGGTGEPAGAGGKKPKGKGKTKGKKDKTPPDTRITKGPPGRTHKHTAKFKFVSTEANSTFQCKLDRKPFKTCQSPKKYKRLKPGKHVFKVRAIDAAGNVDPTPAVKRFKVLK